ncbi:MAG TPA: YraN family protein [Candidatus Paceibacterota bacterium]|jgi:putative endonuclease|nr:YraN family protein [Candidatus Paceibacterota bacterium]
MTEKADNISIGRHGESIAVNYLIKNKWIVLTRNYKRKGDEIDIIAKSPDKTLVFLEVKTLVITSLSTLDALMPEDNLTSAKRRKLNRTCEFFARKNDYLIDEEMGWRIDLIAIELFANRIGVSALRHYENI